VDRAEVAVLEEVDEEVLGRLLEREEALGRPAEGLGRDVVRDLAREAREGELPDEEVRRALVAPDLAECDGAGPEAVRLACGGRVVGGR
jgi:hypothetical protein